jgi:mRNA interferase YafQ
MLAFETTAQYRRDVIKILKQGIDRSLLDEVINTLLEEKPLEPKHKDRALNGDYTGQRECRINSDWLLIYAADKRRLVLTATRIGAHSELFGRYKFQDYLCKHTRSIRCKRRGDIPGSQIKYGIKSLLRTPVKTFMFMLLITAVTGFLSLGAGMYDSAEKMLDEADEVFMTAGEFRFTLGDYPDGYSGDVLLREAREAFG